jgi:hypothetical protein
MTEHVKITIADHVLHITLARPEKKNALTQAMYVAMGEALTRAESDPAVRAVLIDSEGDSFTAGNDIADFAAVATGAVSRDKMQTHVFLEALARGTKPYVAAVAGLGSRCRCHDADALRCLVRRRRRSPLDAVRQPRARSGSRFVVAHSCSDRLRPRVSDCSRSASRSMARLPRDGTRHGLPCLLPKFDRKHLPLRRRSRPSLRVRCRPLRN